MTFVERVLKEYEEIFNDTKSSWVRNDKMRRFERKLSQARAFGVISDEEWEEINAGKKAIYYGGMRHDAAKLAAALN